ncbi:MAG: hypothetical protein KatS3mg088_261 [Patescibacteria group bacterium]|nr:MAG: hypothetical protein KatS3mg088_261 [Patescibacteria group bacterium]
MAAKIDIFEKLSRRIKKFARKIFFSFISYIKKLIFPIYLFPIKIFTYSLYYSIRFAFKFIFTFFSLIFETIIFPFKSLKNFLKSIFFLAIFVYLLFSVLVIADYLSRQYGNFRKIFCDLGVKERLRKSVVRVIGGYSQGSGFFISPNRVVTNFHVVDGEIAPKIILPDGRMIIPEKFLGNKEADIAVIFTKEEYPQLVLPVNQRDILEKIAKGEVGFENYQSTLSEDAIVFAAGYPLGTEIKGNPTILKGRFLDYRISSPIVYIQTDITLVEGMSGGPFTDVCGEVVGINTKGVGGMSFFLFLRDAWKYIDDQKGELLSDKDIRKIAFDPSKSPQEAVSAFYAYISARRMEDGFSLLSEKYKQKTNLEEWSSRFRDVIDIQVWKVELEDKKKNRVFVKFSTKNWTNQNVEIHHYEGTWEVVLEDGFIK